MQTLGRIALISGLVFVALLNIVMFAGVESLEQSQKAEVYARIYLMALVIPLVSVSGVVLSQVMLAARARRLRETGFDADEADRLVYTPGEPTEPNYWMFGGGALFVVLTLAIGIGDVPLAQEIVFAGSMAIVATLIYQLVQKLPRAKARALVGTALIIFVFRAVPLPGAGATWFLIDRLGFDQQFLSVLSLIASCLTLIGMVLLRPLMATRSIAYIVVLLTLAAGVLALPNIGLYYGVQNWTARLTGGVVDARFIAIIDTTLKSPLGQVAMIPLLTWIARNAPVDLKATFFAVMASFTNLALSASSLLTKYMNQIFLVTREVKDRATGAFEVPADYSQLGWLLITVALIGVLAPLLTVLVVQRSRLRTRGLRQSCDQCVAAPSRHEHWPRQTSVLGERNNGIAWLHRCNGESWGVLEPSIRRQNPLQPVTKVPPPLAWLLEREHAGASVASDLRCSFFSFCQPRRGPRG